MLTVVKMSPTPVDTAERHRRQLLYMVVAGVAIVFFGLYSLFISIVSGNLWRTAVSVTALWVGSLALVDNYRQWRQARRATERNQTWRGSE